MVIDFYASWCRPCKNFAPTFSKLSDAHPAVTFAKVDIDEVDISAVDKLPAVQAVPTFVVMNEYEDPYARLPVVHIDAYRLSGDEELANAGWDRVFDGVTIVLVEWPERVEASLPEPRWDVQIDHVSETDRRVSIAAPLGRDLARLEALSRPMVCRICGTPVPLDAATFPFCSDRCRTIDLGKWITGDYKITREVKDSDLETTD